MKIQRSKDWWVAKARQEEGCIGAGLLAVDPRSQAAVEALSDRPIASVVDETRIAFGRFVHLMRRERGLSIETLADQASLDLGELVSIEENLDYTPEPRTVYQLACAFGVSQQGLMQLAGLAVANDLDFRQAAVRFAARSESSEKLNRDQRAALAAFVEVLSQVRDIKKSP